MIMVNYISKTHINEVYKLRQYPKALAPTQRTWREIAYAAGRMALRLILVLPALHDIARAAMRLIAGKLILPASIYPELIQPYCAERPNYGMDEDRARVKEEIVSNYPGAFKSQTLITPDGARLDGMYYIPPEARTDKLLIHLNGNFEFYEYSLESKIRLAKQLGIPLLVFNSRGVGNSTGTPTPEGLALDVYTAYKFANDRLGVSPSNVLTYGWSLGGAYGNLGAALVQEEFEKEKVHVVNDRSFSSLDAEVCHLFGNGRIARLCCAILRWTGWEMDSKAAMDKLKGNKLVIHAPEGDDCVIPHAASMRKASDASIRTLPLTYTRSHYDLHEKEQRDIVNDIAEFLGYNPAEKPLVLFDKSANQRRRVRQVLDRVGAGDKTGFVGRGRQIDPLFKGVAEELVEEVPVEVL